MNRKLLAALYVAMGLSLPQGGALAANADGSLGGRLTGTDSKPVAGAEVTVRNPETGFTRTVVAGADGQYRFQSLPVGSYTLEARKDGASLGRVESVSVALGSATTADVALATGTLEAVEVTGTRVVNAVDVGSTESATNMTREELERLPIQRDVLSVAMLAPGNTKGDGDLGDGVSFGGSSVAENSVYINGLNVTDFYNRVGASTVPYAFYKEFQVKTGGYSVEYGRTTGGVINAVTRSGTNEFQFGTEVTWEPAAWQGKGRDVYDSEGAPYVIASHDDYDRTATTLYASGPIVKDRLFFFALYENSDYRPVNTNNGGDLIDHGKSDDGFWGAKIDWQINDRNLVELLAFSDRSDLDTKSYDFDLAAAQRGAYQNTEFEDNGGDNWALTYTGYLTDSLSVRVLYGENERRFSRLSLNDIDCTRIVDNRDGVDDSELGCTSVSNVTQRDDTREAARLDFEWGLADHQLRFGLDREVNTSDHEQYYPGPERLRYDIFDTEPGATLANGGVVPGGVDAYVRTRSNEVDGSFETLNTAWYVEDYWSATPDLVLNAGVRLESFDNRNSDGDSYIKIDDMVAPRLGFSWDVRGDRRSKIFGNAGRYFLPVANVINIKQAGGFLDERTYYAFDGTFTPFEYNGQTYQNPNLGAQIGPVDNSQGDGTVGDLRGEVDRDMQPVYQDELILGYQGMIDDKWSWGVRGIYRKLTNAIDDMEVTSNGILCGGEPGYVGFVMANPGRTLTVYTDTDCDGENDGFVDIDTHRAGWALYDDDGNYVGEQGWVKPKRDYKALEFVVDRAWDDRWSFNASYTLSFSEGNAEGPVNSDTDFADSGRTEAFDDPWVNLNGYGYLPNDRRHQVKLRGALAAGEHWQFGGTLDARSGRPVNAFGVGNPFDGTNYRSFYLCEENCDAENPSERVYRLAKRGSQGDLPWTYDLGAFVSYAYAFSVAELNVRLSVFNLLNEDVVQEVNEQFDDDIGFQNPNYGIATRYQSPRYAMLTFSLDF